VHKWLQSKGIESLGDDLVLRKELNSEGKSRVQINSALAPTQYLKELGILLAEIHRQNEEIRLLDKDKQLELLDEFANLESLRSKVKAAFFQFRSQKSKLIELQLQSSDKDRKIDLFRYQIEEIESARISQEEEDSLLQEEKILMHSEKISNHLHTIHEILSEPDSGILAQLSRILPCADKIQSLKPDFESITDEFQEIYTTLKDTLIAISDTQDEVFFSFERLEYVQNRLDEISRLKKKYGRNVTEILEYKNKIEKELEVLEEGEMLIDTGSIQLEEYRKQLTELSIELSNQRRKAISELEFEIQKELEEQGMKESKLQIVMRWESSQEGDILTGGKKYFITENGLDQVDFYFSANSGEKPRPLRKVASGGELSRIMLALKIALGKKDSQKLLVFDEIDSGISGEIAHLVAKKLRKLSGTHQILLITHQQAIAGISQQQIHVEKKNISGRTVTNAFSLQGESRAVGLARMVSGNTITQGALEHARELLNKIAI
jgi:DNA repair protein RecN (Recombination protein N)